jgi:hypothetical protein
MSVFFPVRSVNWRYPTVKLVFEECDQQDPNWGDLQSLRVSRQKPGAIKAEEKHFVSIVGIALNSQSLVVVESFWREGESEWVSGKFINAFVSFYLVLEGLYGSRKTKNYQIEQAFLASTELRASIENFLNDQHPLQHIDQIIKLVKVGNRLPTRVELIKLLVSIRGRLHHFQNNPKCPQGSPLAHDDYEGMAYLVRCLAHKGIVAQAVKVKPVMFVERCL